MGFSRAFASIWKFVAGPKNGDPAGSNPPLFLAFRSSTLLITITVCLAIFTDIFLYGLIVPVIPFSLTVQANVPEEDVQRWTAVLLAVYNGALCIGSPIVGFYADHSESRRIPLLLGLFALAGATVLLCVGRTVVLLVLGRVLQGLSAAVVWSVGLALLVDTVGRDVGQSMGYVNTAMAVGLLISPVIGGAVYAASGYYAVYYIAFAFICCDIGLRLVLIEKKDAKRWLDVDANSQVPSARASNNNCLGSRDPAGEALPSAEKPRSPQLELIKSKRMVAVLLGAIIEATLM
jgi:MFS family permease